MVYENILQCHLPGVCPAIRMSLQERTGLLLNSTQPTITQVLGFLLNERPSHKKGYVGSVMINPHVFVKISIVQAHNLAF